MRTIKIFSGVAIAAVGILMAIPAFAASLYLSPQSGSYYVGHSFTVNVDVSSPDQAMNAAQGELSFPPGKLQVVSLSKANSIMTIWVQEPSFSNSDGVVNFQGVAVSPGFQGNQGNIITVTFQAISAGNAPITFLSGAVLANDGKGTNILNGMQGADDSLTALPAGVGGGASSQNLPATTITSDPSVTPGTWYNFDAINFSWTNPTDTDGVSYAISTDPHYQLPQVSSGLVSQASYDLTQVSDGVWYFFLSFESGGSWSAPAVKEFDLDRTPPNPFVIVREDGGGDLTDTRPAFQWAATDQTSGVADYQVKIGDGNWFDASTIQQGSSYVLPLQSLTNGRTLTVRAFDRAGNTRDASLTFQVLAPCEGNIELCSFSRFAVQWGWFLLGLIGLFIAIAFGLIYRLFHWRKKIKTELVELKADLRRDIKRLEGHEGPLKADLEKEMKKIEKLSDE